MDMGEFIAEIRKRECLWNRKKIPFNEQQGKLCDQLWKQVATACNIPTRKKEYEWGTKVPFTEINQQWEEVAKAFKISKATAKTKWRSLRDNFHRLIKKVPVYTSGDSYFIEESDKPCWRYFNSLLFLLATIKPEAAAIDINDDAILDISSLDDFDSTNTETNFPDETPLISNAPQAESNTLLNNKNTHIVEEDHNTNMSVGKIKVEDEELKKLSQYVPPEAVVRIPFSENRVSFLNGPPPLVMIQPQITYSSLKIIKLGSTCEKTGDSNLAHEQYNKCPSKKRAYESEVNPNLLKLTDASVDEQHPSKKPAYESVVKPSLLKLTDKSVGGDKENVLFFRSILPLMNKLNDLKQLELRLKFQEIVLEEFGP